MNEEILAQGFNPGRTDTRELAHSHPFVAPARRGDRLLYKDGFIVSAVDWGAENLYK